MPSISFAEAQVSSRYPVVGNEEARGAIAAGLGTIAGAMRIEREPNKSAVGIYVGLLRLRDLKDQSGVGACTDLCKQTLKLLAIDQAGGDTVNASHFRPHGSFIKNRCARLFPDIKAMATRSAVLLYIGCDDLTLPLVEENDDWMTAYSFNS